MARDRIDALQREVVDLREQLLTLRNKTGELDQRLHRLEVREELLVSRRGRPDLAGHALAAVQAPTLLIVGGLDHAVVAMNREALAQLRAEKKLEIVPGATHLFEEPGTLGQVAVLAREWFLRYLVPSAAGATTPASR